MDHWNEPLDLEIGDTIIWRGEGIVNEEGMILISPGMKGKVITRSWSSKTGKKCEGPLGTEKAYGRLMRKKAGVRCFQFHALRHSAASLVESRNIPIGSIQRILGHSSRMTTEIYLHQIAQADRHAVKVLEQSDSGDFLIHESHTGGESSLTQSP